MIPFWVPRCRIIIGNQKGTTILTTTQMNSQPSALLNVPPASRNSIACPSHGQSRDLKLNVHQEGGLGLRSGVGLED